MYKLNTCIFKLKRNKIISHIFFYIFFGGERGNKKGEQEWREGRFLNRVNVKDAIKNS